MKIIEKILAILKEEDTVIAADASRVILELRRALRIAAMEIRTNTKLIEWPDDTVARWIIEAREEAL